MPRVRARRGACVQRRRSDSAEALPVPRARIQRRGAGAGCDMDRRAGGLQGAGQDKDPGGAHHPYRPGRAAVEGKALPGAGALRRPLQGAGADAGPRAFAAVGGGPFRRHPRPRSADHHGLCQRGRGVPRGGQCPVQPGRGRHGHQPCPHLHHRHRLFRPFLGGRECRPAASGQLDPHRLAGRCRGPGGHLCLCPAGPQGTAPRGALRRRAGQVAAGQRPRGARTRPATTRCARKSAASSPKSCARR